MIHERDGLPVLAFTDAAAFEAWMAAQPPDCRGLWLRLAKAASGALSVSKSDAIDVALCHGWIDGQLQPYDQAGWLVRFTPRKRGSKWSAINRQRAVDLIATGRMRAAGLAQIAAAKTDGRWEAAYAPASTAEPPLDLRAALDASPEAATFFAKLKGAQRYAVLYRVQTAKRPETRARRIAEFVAMLARGETLH